MVLYTSRTDAHNILVNHSLRGRRRRAPAPHSRVERRHGSMARNRIRVFNDFFFSFFILYCRHDAEIKIITRIFRVDVTRNVHRKSRALYIRKT